MVFSERFFLDVVIASRTCQCFDSVGWAIGSISLQLSTKVLFRDLVKKPSLSAISSAIGDRLCDALCQLKPCQVPHSSTKNDI